MKLRLYALYYSYITIIFKHNIMGRPALDGAPINLQAIADMQNPPLSRERTRQIINKALRELRGNKQVVDSLMRYTVS